MASSLVCLHGFTHTGASWRPVARSLGPRYRVLAPDIRGHGSASDMRPVSLECVLDDVSEQAPDRFELCGYSMGGRLALHAALVAGRRVGRLVLIGASPGLEDDDEAFFVFSSFTVPRQVYKTSVSTGKVELLAKIELPVDTDLYTVQQAFYPSKDGT